MHPVPRTALAPRGSAVISMTKICQRAGKVEIRKKTKIKSYSEWESWHAHKALLRIRMQITSKICQTESTNVGGGGRFSPKSTAQCFFCCFQVKGWGHSQSYPVCPSFFFLEIPAISKPGLLQCCRRIITQIHQRLYLPMHAFTVCAVHCVFKLQPARVSGGPGEMSDKCTRSPFAESLMPV